MSDVELRAWEGKRQKAKGTRQKAEGRRPIALLLAALLLTASCAGGSAAGPVGIDLGRDTCSHCRMAIVSLSTAAEIVAPGEEPRLFDDLGCLRDFAASSPPGSDAVVFVTDYQSGRWIEARHAAFTKTSLQTPMGSGLVAHAGDAAREQDPVSRGGPAVPLRSILR